MLLKSSSQTWTSTFNKAELQNLGDQHESRTIERKHFGLAFTARGPGPVADSHAYCTHVHATELMVRLLALQTVGSTLPDANLMSVPLESLRWLVDHWPQQLQVRLLPAMERDWHR